MKIIFNSTSNDLTNDIVSFGLSKPENKIEVIPAKAEKAFFDQIAKENADAYVIENSHPWTQKAIDFIRKRNPYVPIIVLLVKETSDSYIFPNGAQFYIFNPKNSIHPIQLFESIYRTLLAFRINFGKLQRLTVKLKKEIEFGHFYKYDPVRRNFRYKDKLVKKLSPKEGGVLEILSANFQELVKKEIIMEKVWHRTDFYTGRSMDVYITNLRNLFKKFELPITIKNIPKEGLILEYHD